MWVYLSLLCCCLWVDFIESESLHSSHVKFSKVFVEFGKNIGGHVRNRLEQHFRSVKKGQIVFVESASQMDIEREESLTNTLFLSFGNASMSLNHIPPDALKELPDESFQVYIDNSKLYTTKQTCYISVNGNPLPTPHHQNVTFDRQSVHYGAITGSYYVMEMLGFGFFHPLEPYSPPYLYLDEKYSQSDSISRITESPHWPERGFHLHTQHPLELTEVLQGHDIPRTGPHGRHCLQFAKRMYPNQSYEERTEEPGYYCERWEDMVIDVDYFYEWAVANRLNRVEWLLLGHYQWQDELRLRQHRLHLLTTLGHQYSLLIGADVPIGNIQQHAWYMVNVRLPFPEQVKQIESRVNWIFQTGFDFLTTENGLSEFTHPECDLMLDLLNAFTIYINETWHRETAIKVHCSTGQKCDSFLDPRTGDPTNFNFLPSFAHGGLGVLPHTVQMYAFDDPTSGTYGNDNFTYMEEYLVYEAKQGIRPVIYYGETSYWVNYDIDVPLFLPIYGQRRQKDLRKIAIREQSEGFKMQGQMNFDSGWEWTYWLNDVITARASWDPMISIPSLSSASSASSSSEQCRAENTTTNIPQCASPYIDEWTVFHQSLNPISRLFGPIYGPQFNALVIQIAQQEVELLVLGRIDGRPNPNIHKLSGIAYLCGTDTWVELPRKLGLAFTQPDKVHMKENTDPHWPYVMELLTKMDTVFEGLSNEMDSLYSHMDQTYQQQQQHQTNDKIVTEGFELTQATLHLMLEFQQSMKLLSFRSKQVKLLYESSDSDLLSTSTLKKKLHLQARMIIEEASEIVKTREDMFYRVAWQRIASWRENPTVYRFGYLWSVHSLYYWWRDQGLVEQTSNHVSQYNSPCYLNRMDASEVVVGWGKYYLQWLRYWINSYLPFLASTSSYVFYPLEIINCLSPPSHEYQFPRDMY